jgi:hypothetical protein
VPIHYLGNLENRKINAGYKKPPCTKHFFPIPGKHEPLNLLSGAIPNDRKWRHVRPPQILRGTRQSAKSDQVRSAIVNAQRLAAEGYNARRSLEGCAIEAQFAIRLHAVQGDL